MSDRVAPPAEKRRMRDPNAPKRPLSAFLLFTAAVRPQVVAELFPDGAQRPTEVMEKIASKWKEMTEEEKQPHVDNANEDKARYDREMAAYQSNDPVAAEPPMGPGPAHDVAPTSAHTNTPAAAEPVPTVTPDVAPSAAADSDGPTVRAPAARSAGHDVVEKQPRPRRVRDPNAPKRAMSAYMHFAQAIRPQVVRDMFPDGAQVQVVAVLQKIGTMWKDMAEEEKQPYYQMAEVDKARFEREMAAYEDTENKESAPVAVAPSHSDRDDMDEAVSDDCAGLGAEASTAHKKELKSRARSGRDPNAPKRAASAFMHFCSVTRPQIAPGMKFGDVSVKLGLMWRELTEQEKQVYLQMSEDDKARYERELAAYQQM